MTTTTRPTPTGPAAVSPNGHKRPQPPNLVPPKRRVRLPELAVGLLVTVAFSLGAVLWHLSSTGKVAALAVNSEVQRGTTIDAADVRTVYVSSDDQLARLTDPSAVIGKVAAVDLPPGTLLTPSVVADAVALQPGDGVVGLALDPGQYPALGLAPGDHVTVVRSGDAAIAASGAGNDKTSAFIARDATVVEVEKLASDRKLVSIRAPQRDAEAVAAVAGSNTLRLVTVTP